MANDNGHPRVAPSAHGCPRSQSSKPPPTRAAIAVWATVLEASFAPLPGEAAPVVEQIVDGPAALSDPRARSDAHGDLTFYMQLPEEGTR